jgi:electron transfer flavoprotein beta subunit
VKILVCTKRVPDTDQPLTLANDRKHLQLEHVSFVLNPFDAIALEEALRIREGPIPATEVLAVGVGPEDCRETLRTALAMGADRAVLVRCDVELDPAGVSRVLVEVVRRESPGLVLMGKQAVDDDANQTGQFLAAQLGWPQATFASQIEWLAADRLRVARETDAGIEWVRVSLPAVVTADLRLNEPRYASLVGIMRARKKTIEEIPIDELGVPVDTCVELVSLEASRSQRQCMRVRDVDELIHRLRWEAQVL